MFIKREEKIKLWFDMWLDKKDIGIDNIFNEEILYIESYGPKYEGVEQVKYWFNEWNFRGTVKSWDIKQFFHKDNQTVVVWYFECKMNKDDKNSKFDGTSLIKWTDDNKIKYLKEFACEINNYNPYNNQ